jgi:hypothetical protein
MQLSRRDIIKNAGMLAAVTGLGGLALSMGANAGAQTPDKQMGPPDLPWPYKKIDPLVVAEEAYAGYYKGACGYGVFEGIVGQLRKEIGFPYTLLPSTMLVVSQGGVADTASLCGAVNGAASAIFLVAGGMENKKREIAYPIIWEVFNWYEQTALPDYRPKNPKFDIVKSVSRSTLCHISVTKWCKAAGFKAFSKERSERCAWITASVAKYTAETLNNYADGAFKMAQPLTAATKTCRSCHDKGSKLENTRAMMDCGGCHFTPKAKTEHPKF